MGKTIIGLTGNFCSGKTQVADLLEQKGAFIINADEAGHLLLKKEKVKEQLIKLFGKEIVRNGEIDRKILRDIVFADKDNVVALNTVVHPALIKDIEEKIERIKDGVVVIEAAILFELGLNKISDIVVTVSTEEKKSIERAAEKGFPAKTAESILKNQISQNSKIELSDFVIDNNGTMNDLKQGVEKLWKKVQKVQKV
ncbi:MAG: dephospho-CoA kinase [Candidatus Omnitrophica bacterium]|nr:dephospho-CoA kinase [Candidatus Omnitrophota bacterium]